MDKKEACSLTSCWTLWLACVLFIVAGGTAWAGSASAENTFVTVGVTADNPVSIVDVGDDFYIGTEDDSVDVTITADAEFDLVEPDPATLPITINAGDSEDYAVEGIPPETMDGAGTMYFVHINISEVISDQLPGIEVNKLPVGDGSAGYNDPNNPMIMGDRADDDKAYLRVKTSVDPGASASSSLVGVREEGNIAILDSHAVVQGGKTPLSFDSKSRSLYEVVAGIDGNGDGDLEDSEVCAVFPQKVLTITQNDYDSDKYFLHNVTLLAWGSLPTANTLLDAFLDQDIPGGFTESDDSLEPSDLIHPLGADWTPASSSDCKLFNHDNLTTVLFSYNLRTNIWHDASVHHTSEMINHFNAYPTDDKEWFGPYDFSFPDLSFEKGSAVDDNLYYAFHGVSNATGKYWLEVDDD